MANPRIEVEIGANVVGLTAGVNTATGQLDKLGKAAQTTAPQVQKLAQATQGYNSVGIDFARIVQDAPFGIIGVGNNITQLAQSFQTLKNTSGSTSAALKSAFASIFSSGNALILGISVLTTAFTILQQKGFFKSEESAKSLDEALKEYQETLTGVAAATLKGAQDAQKELAVLKSLEIQATNTAVSTDKRLQAVNELQKQYPDYFGNLTKEQILNGQVGDAYLKVADNLLAKAKAQAATNQIAQNGIELLRIETKLEEQRAKRLLETSAAQAQVDALIEKRQKEGFLTQGDLQRYDTLIKSINNSNESLEEEKTLKTEISRINKENDALTQNITKQIEAGATFTKATKQEAESIKRSFEDISKLDFLDTAKLERTGAFFEGVEKQLVSIESGVARTRGIYTKNVEAIKKSNEDFAASLQGSGISVEQFYAAIANGAAEGFSSLDQFVQSLSTTQQFINGAFESLEEGIENTIGDVAFAIGDALASGGNVLQAGGAALLEGVAGIMNQLGQMAIKAGLTIAAIKKSLQTLNPYVAIAAGIALVALAGFVSSKAKSLGGGGSGGGVGGGGSSVGGSGVGGGSSFTGGGAQGGLFEQNRDVSGEFVVKGQDLVYVLGQANNRINKG
jgi:uncharacterized membrane protein YgcG